MAFLVGTCPKCAGKGRVPLEENLKKYSHLLFDDYDKEDGTISCCNCGGQYSFGIPSGRVPLRKDNGEPCLHEYVERTVGPRQTQRTCKHCGDSIYSGAAYNPRIHRGVGRAGGGILKTLLQALIFGIGVFIFLGLVIYWLAH